MRSILSTLLALAALAAAAILPAFAGDPPNRDAEAAQFLAALPGAMRDQKDEEAVASVKRLVAIWKDKAVKDDTKAPVPTFLEKYSKKKSVPAATAAISAFVELGRGTGGQMLVRTVNGLLLQKDAAPELIAAAFAALKKLADPDPSVTKPLAKCLLDKDDQVVAKAADALSGYADAPPDVRRDLFENMLRRFDDWAAAAAKGADKAAVDRWTVVGPSAVAALSAVSHQKFADVAAASAWFKKNSTVADAWK